jgi:hypothetical protein
MQPDLWLLVVLGVLPLVGLGFAVNARVVRLSSALRWLATIFLCVGGLNALVFGITLGILSVPAGLVTLPALTAAIVSVPWLSAAGSPRRRRLAVWFAVAMALLGVLAPAMLDAVLGLYAVRPGDVGALLALHFELSALFLMLVPFEVAGVVSLVLADRLGMVGKGGLLGMSSRGAASF